MNEMNLFSFSLSGIERSEDTKIYEPQPTVKWFPCYLKIQKTAKVRYFQAISGFLIPYFS